MLNIYKIDIEYNNFLRSFDNKVSKNYDEKERRPYIGLLISINDFYYFAPLSSPKAKHKKMNNMLDFEKIENGKYGAINFNNMIPVKLNFAEPIIIKNEKDLKYKDLLNNQYLWINKNEAKLTKKAKKLYDLYKNNKLDNFVKSRCCNFTLLEEKCELYIPEFYIYQDKEQGKLELFTEEKNEDRYNLYGKIEVPNNQIGIVIGVKQLSDKTTFALIDEEDKNQSFYSTITNKVYETINKLNEEVQSISQ